MSSDLIWYSHVWECYSLLESGLLINSSNVPTECIFTDEHHCSFDQIKKVSHEFVLGKVIGSNCMMKLLERK